jgi:hypothetical protein
MRAFQGLSDDRSSGFTVAQFDAFGERIAHAFHSGGVYVHCNHGRSRGPAMVMAFLMRYVGFTFNQARAAVAAGARAAGVDDDHGPSVIAPPRTSQSHSYAVVEAQLRAYAELCATRAHDAPAVCQPAKRARTVSTGAYNQAPGAQ